MPLLRLKRSVVLWLILLLTACSTAPTKPPLNKETIAANAPPAVPKYEPRTRAGNKDPYTVWGKTYRVLPTALGYRETGHASWYGPKFHGRDTSNGEVFDMYAISAAHKTLPIPSYVKVTNLANQRSLWVRVNDRGPFIGERLIDLSYAAALQLGFVDQGVATVTIEAVEFNADGSMQSAVPLRPEPMAENTAAVQVAQTSSITADDMTQRESVLKAPSTYLQVGRYRDEAAARTLADSVYRLLNQPVVIHKDQNQSYIVVVGPLQDNELGPLKTRLADAGFEGAFTRRGL